MAMSKCGSCNTFLFELKEAEPRNSRYKVNFIQCSSCGAVVGVMDFYGLSNVMAKIDALSKDMERVSSQVGAIAAALSRGR